MIRARIISRDKLDKECYRMIQKWEYHRNLSDEDIRKIKLQKERKEPTQLDFRIANVIMGMEDE